MTASLALPQNAGTAIGNAALPAEGPKAVPILLDFTVQPAYEIDPLQLFMQKTLSIIQCVYVDNALNPSPLTIDVPGTSQDVIAPPYSQGYYPILSPTSGKITVSSPGANIALRIHLINVPMPASVWEPNASDQPTYSFDGGGNLKTVDQGLAPIIDPAKGLKVQGIAGGGGGHAQECLTQFIGNTGGNVGFTVNDGWVSMITSAEVWMTNNAYAAAEGLYDIRQSVYNSPDYIQGRSQIYLPGAAPATPLPGAQLVYKFDGMLTIHKDWLYGGAMFVLPALAGGAFSGSIWGYSYDPNA